VEKLGICVIFGILLSLSTEGLVFAGTFSGKRMRNMQDVRELSAVEEKQYALPSALLTSKELQRLEHLLKEITRFKPTVALSEDPEFQAFERVQRRLNILSAANCLAANRGVEEYSLGEIVKKAGYRGKPQPMDAEVLDIGKLLRPLDWVSVCD
jgi:hypothetical protein